MADTKWRTRRRRRRSKGDEGEEDEEWMVLDRV